jgi:hypothetical protein
LRYQQAACIWSWRERCSMERISGCAGFLSTIVPMLRSGTASSRDVTTEYGGERVTNLRIENCVLSDNHNLPEVGWLDDTDEPAEEGFGGGMYLR